MPDGNHTALKLHLSVVENLTTETFPLWNIDSKLCIVKRRLFMLREWILSVPSKTIIRPTFHFQWETAIYVDLFGSYTCQIDKSSIIPDTIDTSLQENSCKMQYSNYSQFFTLRSTISKTSSEGGFSCEENTTKTANDSCSADKDCWWPASVRPYSRRAVFDKLWKGSRTLT